jgi:transposase
VEAVKRGVKQNKAAEMFGVSVKAVNNWVKTYREYGDKGLDAQKQGRLISIK